VLKAAYAITSSANMKGLKVRHVAGMVPAASKAFTEETRKEVVRGLATFLACEIARVSGPSTVEKMLAGVEKGKEAGIQKEKEEVGEEEEQQEWRGESGEGGWEQGGDEWGGVEEGEKEEEESIPDGWRRLMKELEEGDVEKKEVITDGTGHTTEVLQGMLSDVLQDDSIYCYAFTFLKDGQHVQFGDLVADTKGVKRRCLGFRLFYTNGRYRLHTVGYDSGKHGAKLVTVAVSLEAQEVGVEELQLLKGVLENYADSKLPKGMTRYWWSGCPLFPFIGVTRSGTYTARQPVVMVVGNPGGAPGRFKFAEGVDEVGKLHSNEQFIEVMRKLWAISAEKTKALKFIVRYEGTPWAAEFVATTLGHFAKLMGKDDASVSGV
jgi:hypothetical protein